MLNRFIDTFVVTTLPSGILPSGGQGGKDVDDEHALVDGTDGYARSVNSKGRIPDPDHALAWRDPEDAGRLPHRPAVDVL